MSLLRNAIKSNVSLRAIRPTHGLRFLLRQSPRRFSTETEQPPPPPADDSSVDTFLKTPNEGLVYGRLLGVARYTLKTDIINLLEGSKLTLDDVKVNYTRNYMPVGVLLQFHSRHAFENAFRELNKKGRLYKLEKIDRLDWDPVMPYNGRSVLLQGIPQNAPFDDVERFLAGCEYDASSIQMIPRPPTKIAIVRFPTPTQAMNAFLTKNRGFCGNNQITMRVLQ